MKLQWHGVMPALTTAFNQDLSVATLTPSEKAEILNACLKGIGSRVPVVAGVSALSTREAVMLAKTAEDTGCSGLVVLPPYVYAGDWRKMKTHVGICSARVRPPRLDLIGSELDEARTIIAHAPSTRPPDVISTAFDHAHEAAAVR
jgi:dihydrodipicolinate synthase/N-acetylneuraminate lyase